ncbi:MAG: signal peptidase I [Gammaproteobacteria bacterium]|nr:signal peptidase I [Gammaproteobacteria bacterium]
MTFDFSAVLVLLTAASGFIWGLEHWLLAPRRRLRAAATGQAAQPVGEPWWAEYSRSFFPVFLIVLLLRSFLVEPFRIPSGSMMPTLLIGDFILVNKYQYGIRLPVLNTLVMENTRPRRGDIVVFRYPEDPSVPFIKRVVGVPGDHIIYRDKSLFVNGELMPQEADGQGGEAVEGGGPLLRQSESLGRIRHGILVDPYRLGPAADTVVPEGHYFVMGDNRDNSRDSRYWGFVPDENLIGRAFFIWMNLSFKNGGVRWNRIGTILE